MEQQNTTPWTVLLVIIQAQKVSINKKEIDAEKISQIRFGSTPAEKFIVYFTMDGNEEAVRVPEWNQSDFEFAKELALNSGIGSDKKFNFSATKKEIKTEISGNDTYSVFKKIHYGQESVLISAQPGIALFWAEEFFKEIREKEHAINSKPETGDKFSPYAETLHMFSTELEKVVLTLRKLFSSEQQTQTSAE